MTTEKKHIGIIGAGLSSLYASCFLAKNGYDVTVFEKNKNVGGRTQYFEVDGFRFDMGPSWYWMPELIDSLFDDLEEDRKEHFLLNRLETSYQVFWDDNSTSKIPSDLDALHTLFESFEENGSVHLKEFLKSAEIKYNIAVSLLENPGLSITELMKWRVIKNGLQLDVLKSVEKDVAARFTSSKARSILNFPVLFLGSLPSNIPSLYTLMNHADLKLGTWYPSGGMHSLANALHDIALKNGVHFQMNSKVEEILVASNKVSGLRVDGVAHKFDFVIAGADYQFVEQNLVPQKYRKYTEKYWSTRKMAPSSLIYYVGVKRKIPELSHHNLFFDEDLIAHGKEIYSDPKWPSKPLFYICSPSQTDPQVAPKECENLFFLMPIATNLPDPEQLRETYFELMLDRLQRRTGVDIRPDIVFKRSFCVQDFKTEYNSYKGNAYGLANTLRQTANLKPKMKSKLKNLFFCGQLTVPGPGIPPALISGKIAAQQIMKS